MAARLVAGSGGWVLGQAPESQGHRASRRAERESAIPEMFLKSDSIRVDEVLHATPRATARRALPMDLELEVDLESGESSLLAIRHPSGALTFHRSIRGVERAGRRGASAAATQRFRVPVRHGSGSGARRGAGLSSVFKIVVLKFAKAAVDTVLKLTLPKLAAVWEAHVWSRKGLKEGWFRVNPTGRASPRLELVPEVPKPGRRALLLLHGTFSNAAAAFAGLASTDFFERVRPLYEGRIYAYNHFSISRTPDENARLLRSSLPAGDYQFDAVTHSRGGLVVRSLVERQQAQAGRTARLSLGHAVLVASPNDGTPLATPQRWEDTVGWLANLLEVFPDNPFTTAGEFISEALVWLASHVVGDLPGLRAMDARGQFIAELQAPPGPPPESYSALVANFSADGALWQRALDVGIDYFFGTANDLVVPSEGGWRTTCDGTLGVPAERIGCFGPGGNIHDPGTSAVHHLNFFGRAETATFLARALARERQNLGPLDPNAPLPDRRFTRSALAQIPSTEREPDQGKSVGPRAAPSSLPVVVAPPAGDTDTFHIVILDAFDGSAQSGETSGSAKFARIFASYAGARVIEPLRLRAEKGEAPTSFGQIIGFHTRIKDYTNRVRGTLPSDAEMMRFGGLLFETLFQGDVQRLYDEARSRQRRKLDLVFTSMIPWIAEKPWEFAYDTVRRRFLATEEIHFVRNVLTAIPAESVTERSGPLRILVASAQPVGFDRLSIDQESEVIRRGFEPLIEAGLVVVDVLPRTTPSAIHGYLSTGEYSIVHFIGHGVFDEEAEEGYLAFEDARGGAFRLGQRSAREIFCQRGVSLVFLNACQTAAGGRADFNKGIAQALVAHGLPAVVANQYSVLDASATSFAQHFYWSLAQGATFGEAAREARIAVNYSLQGELIDWAVPVLYARNPNQTLCPAPLTRLKVPAMSVRRTSRSAIANHVRRIAVWDIDHVFPALERTLSRLNAVQAIFGFELVDMSAPLDAWDLDTKPGVPYLVAERLAERLGSRTVELRVDLLMCITRHWLRNKTTSNIYGWWPESDTTSPVAVVSCAGFPELEVEGHDTDHAIANTMVAVLAGFLGQLEAHERGAKDCPLAYNRKRELAHIVGPQRFDASCRKKLARHLSPQETTALDALLGVFRATVTKASK